MHIVQKHYLPVVSICQDPLYPILCRHGQHPVLASASADKGVLYRIIHLLIYRYKGRSEKLRFLAHYPDDLPVRMLYLFTDIIF